MKKVLVACEESQAVTIQMRQIGIEAYSCDILPCSGGYPEWHIQQDVSEIMQDNWDMIIAFPPCTHLSSSGAVYWPEKRQDGRQQSAIEFFMMFANAKCDKIAIENPVGIISTVWRKPDQIINPWQFGDSVDKKTCLWLKNLPKLIPTQIVSRGERIEWHKDKTGRKNSSSLWYLETLKQAKNSEERSRLRSKTFPGIAKAMAEQWGALI